MLVEVIFVLVLDIFFYQDYMNKEIFHLSVTDQKDSTERSKNRTLICTKKISNKVTFVEF